MPMRLVAAASLLLACTACAPPAEPPQQTPPPQATELRDAVHAPVDKAKAVEAQVLDAADAQRRAIDAAGG